MAVDKFANIVRSVARVWALIIWPFSRVAKLLSISEPAVRRFIRHNRSVFRSDKLPMKRTREVVIFEMTSMQSAHIAVSYFANVLSVLSSARIEAYLTSPPLTAKHKFLFWVSKICGLLDFGVYHSFGVVRFFEIRPSAAQRKRARAICKSIYPDLRSLRALEDLTINEIWIGDLIYDSYLFAFRRPTINFMSQEFRDFFEHSVSLFCFWEDYFANNRVRAVTVSHCVYNVAIPLRMAINQGIPAFQVNASNVYRPNANNLFAYGDFRYFRERFAALPRDVQEAGLAEAKRRIDRRFAGEVGVDMAYSTKSAYGASRHAQLLRPSSRKKILIATHCFFDSPHSYGNNIFPDFYEWLDFLGRMTEITDYDWYIKTHPDYLPGTKEIIDAFVARYPKLTLLPADASHHQIIAEGIDLALTTYGTIGFEYAALGIPVINASQCNPHIAYRFNLHAKDEADYRRLILDPGSWAFRIDRKEVYEYYFMKFIYNTNDIFFDNYDGVVSALGGHKGQFSPVIYDIWLSEWTEAKHKKLSDAVASFIRSGDFRMDYTHYGRDFRIEPADAST